MNIFHTPTLQVKESDTIEGIFITTESIYTVHIWNSFSRNDIIRTHILGEIPILLTIWINRAKHLALVIHSISEIFLQNGICQILCIFCVNIQFLVLSSHRLDRTVPIPTKVILRILILSEHNLCLSTLEQQAI